MESAAFGGGRIIASSGAGGSTTYTPNYFLTDHLGSTRVVVDGSGNPQNYNRNDYYPFGQRWTYSGIGGAATQNRWLYNGKEHQAVAGLNFLDYGARQYDPILAIWRSIDLLTEKNFNKTPYGFCSGNPVNKVDIDGKDDYFAITGKFLYRNREKTDYIMIITPDPNAKGELESHITGIRSSITDTYLSNKAIRSIVGYYNEQLDRTDGAMPEVEIGTLYHSEPRTLMMVQTKSPNTIKANKNSGDGTADSKGGKVHKLLNTASNMKNALVHERRHVKRKHATDQSISEEEKELDAINAQKEHSTWEGTTDEFKHMTNNYEDYHRKNK